MKKVILLMLVFSCTTGPVIAGSVAMRDYNLLSTGMTEAEVLYRLGPYDHEMMISKSA